MRDVKEGSFTKTSRLLIYCSQLILSLRCLTSLIMELAISNYELLIYVLNQITIIIVSTKFLVTLLTPILHQISDFGLAKWLPDQWTHHTVSKVEGTFGFVSLINSFAIFFYFSPII